LYEPDVVIHLHGSLREAERMIVTTEDYILQYANDASAGDGQTENGIPAFLRELFQKLNVLFIGYGLDELEILEYVILKARTGRVKPETRHYVLQGYFSHEYELMKSLKSYFLGFGIELVPFLKDSKDWDQLLEVLENWAQKIPASAPLVLGQLKRMEELLNE